MSDYKEFLKIYKTDQIDHPTGGSLFVHLCRVYELLKEWKNPEKVCRAGLFHSIYGTTKFTQQTLSLEERSLVQKTIGKEAEYYAYLFCAIDRFNSFYRFSSSYSPLNPQDYRKMNFYNRFTDKTIFLSLKEYKILMEINLANTIDYIENNTDINIDYLFKVIHRTTAYRSFLSPLGYERFLKYFHLNTG